MFSEFKSVNMQNIFYSVHYPRLHYHDMHFAYQNHDILYCMTYTLMLMYFDCLKHALDDKRT